MKRFPIDVPSIVTDRFIKTTGWINKFIRLWGTKVITHPYTGEQVEVLNPEKLVYWKKVGLFPLENEKKLHEHLGTYESFKKQKYKGVWDMFLIFDPFKDVDMKEDKVVERYTKVIKEVLDRNEDVVYTVSISDIASEQYYEYRSSYSVNDDSFSTTSYYASPERIRYAPFTSTSYNNYLNSSEEYSKKTSTLHKDIVLELKEKLYKNYIRNNNFYASTGIFHKHATSASAIVKPSTNTSAGFIETVNDIFEDNREFDSTVYEAGKSILSAIALGAFNIDESKIKVIKVSKGLTEVTRILGTSYNSYDSKLHSGTPILVNSLDVSFKLSKPTTLDAEKIAKWLYEVNNSRYYNSTLYEYEVESTYSISNLNARSYISSARFFNTKISCSNVTSNSEDCYESYYVGGLGKYKDVWVPLSRDNGLFASIGELRGYYSNVRYAIRVDKLKDRTIFKDNDEAIKFIGEFLEVDYEEEDQGGSSLEKFVAGAISIVVVVVVTVFLGPTAGMTAGQVILSLAIVTVAVSVSIAVVSAIFKAIGMDSYAYNMAVFNKLIQPFVIIAGIIIAISGMMDIYTAIGNITAEAAKVGVSQAIQNFVMGKITAFSMKTALNVGMQVAEMYQKNQMEIVNRTAKETATLVEENSQLGKELAALEEGRDWDMFDRYMKALHNPINVDQTIYNEPEYLYAPTKTNVHANYVVAMTGDAGRRWVNYQL